MNVLLSGYYIDTSIKVFILLPLLLLLLLLLLLYHNYYYYTVAWLNREHFFS